MLDECEVCGEAPSDDAETVQCTACRRFGFTSCCLSIEGLCVECEELE